MESPFLGHDNAPRLVLRGKPDEPCLFSPRKADVWHPTGWGQDSGSLSQQWGQIGVPVPFSALLLVSELFCLACWLYLVVGLVPQRNSKTPGKLSVPRP